RSRTEERTQGRDAVEAASTVADLRRVANHPATRCLLACLFTAKVRRAQHPPRTPARKKPARPDGFPHGHGVGRRNASVAAGRPVAEPGSSKRSRSEEHTSELQSREKLVCRLLLE